MTLFVDTSVWYAAADRGDRLNSRARQILSTDEALVCTDHILVECWLLIRGRLHRAAADRFWESLGRVARVEPVVASDLDVARLIADGFPDQDFSIVDLTSFAAMQRLGLDRAASFDQDFAVYRYGPRRGHAFTVVR